MKFSITLIVSNGALACKGFALEADGKLKKTAEAQIYSGRAHVETFTSLRDFVDSRALADTQTAYVYGVPANGVQSQALRMKAKEGPGISRSKTDFKWPDGAGLLFIDVDEAGQRSRIGPKVLGGRAPDVATGAGCALAPALT